MELPVADQAREFLQAVLLGGLLGLICCAVPGGWRRD